MLSIVISYLKRLQYHVRILSRKIEMALFPGRKDQLVEDFHKFYYDSEVWHTTKFLGIETQKCPFDLFIYQEILYEIKPDIIIECGTAFGGGALYLASICELMNHGKVVTNDVAKQGKPAKNNRITYILGSSTSEKVVAEVKQLIKGKKKVMVILDSDHSRDHVLQELDIYNHFVTKGSYLIVEDTNVNSHPVYPEHGPGPQEALNTFLEGNSSFEIDSSREKFFLSFNPRGYLKRVA